MHTLTQRVAKVLLASATLIPLMALACTSHEQPVFSCTTTKGKAVQVCQAEGAIRYAFGRPGAAPETTVQVPNERFAWHSDGGSAMDIIELNFPNGSTRYVVSATRFWRGDLELDAEIRVEQGNRQLAMLHCDVETVRLDEKAITAAKTPY